MRKILFVCHGNICRSPMAEGYLRKLLKDNGIDGVVVDSAGIGALSGYPASENACEVARLNGFSLEDHRARQITVADLEEAEEVLVMEKPQKWMLQSHTEAPTGHIRLLGEFGSHPGMVIDDPYGDDLDGYFKIFEMIRDAVDGYFKKRFIAGEND
jgi:protein-tyrosine phosphatase